MPKAKPIKNAKASKARTRKAYRKVNRHISRLKAWNTLKDSAKAKLQRELSDITLLTPGIANTKTAKNSGKGFLSYILHLAPASVSGFNVCPAASLGCKLACLNTAGRGIYQNTQDSRIRKTLYYVKLTPVFLNQLWSELSKVQAKANRLGLTAVVRLNGTSDIAWENRRVNGLNVFEAFPSITFYDYTKLIHRLGALKASGYQNYSLTFSASESNDSDWNQALALGFNVAIVFDKVPDSFQGFPVINGDADDLRFADAKGVIVGLKAKGKAKRDKTGFVKRLIPSIPVKQAA